MDRLRESLRSIDWMLCIILIIGAGLRFAGVPRGLPYTYDADEPTYIQVALQMVQRADLNPHWWLYPSLMFDLLAIAFWGYLGLGYATGSFRSAADLVHPEIVGMGIGKLALPAELGLARGMVAGFSAASILLVYLIGRRVHPNRWFARLSALLFALSPTVVQLSARLAPDIFLLFFVLLSIYFSLGILAEQGWKNAALAGAAAGLAIAAKYNAAIVLLAPVVALLVRYGLSVWKEKQAYICGVAATAGFFIAVPYALFDFSSFWQGVSWQFFSYTTEGHVGQEGNALAWYVSYLLQMEGWLVLAALLGVAVLVVSRRRTGWVLLSFPVVYFVFVGQMLIRNPRTIMPIVPLLDLFAAFFIVTAAGWLVRRTWARREVALAASVLVVLFVAVPLGEDALVYDGRLLQSDTREEARQWLESNLPAGSRIAQESYTPYLDTRRYAVYAVSGIIDYTPDWYMRNGFEYLILSQGMFQRYYDEPARYPTEVAEYNEITNSFQEIKRFDGDSQIRVYKTNAPLPDHRVNVRFGSASDLVELVGYDMPSGTWIEGQPLVVALYWRTLGQKNEPLEVALHLVRADGRQVGQAGGDLYQGKGSSSGIFRTEWSVAWSGENTPGSYDLQIDVIQTRFAFQAAPRTFRGDSLERFAIEGLTAHPTPPPSSEILGATPATVQWNSGIALAGYSFLLKGFHGGETIPLTFYWRTLQAPKHDYTFFAHLIDTSGAVVAQIDRVPLDGNYPTSLWDAGETVRDDCILKLPADLKPGTYRLEIGWYDLRTLARLPLVGADGLADDHWVLPETIRVESAVP